MNKPDFNKIMLARLEEFNKGSLKKVLLHSCCAPCSTACIERLKDKCELSVFYYNPNIDTIAEYSLREGEQKRYCDSVNIPFISLGYESEKFYQAVKGLENEKEGGSRCEKCFYLRLKKTAEYAKENGYDFFSTTLTVSPLKNAEKINAVGTQIEKEVGISFLPSDFKKDNGYKRSVELSKENQLYRQNYCGCKFSKQKG